MTLPNDAPASIINDVSPANTQLADLAARANAAHQRVANAAGEGLLAAFEAGQALLQARKLCLGRFLAWLPRNFKYSVRTANRYMQFAEKCYSIGGFDRTRMSNLPPQQISQLWSQVLGCRGGKKAPRLTVGSADPVQSAGDGTVTAPDTPEPTAEAMMRIVAVERTATPVDLMPPLVPLFAKLIEECRRVGAGDDCFDGEYADGLADKLEPHYAELVDYMEYRQEWRSRPGYRGGPKSAR